MEVMKKQSRRATIMETRAQFVVIAVFVAQLRFDTEKAEMERSRSLLAVGIVSPLRHKQDDSSKLRDYVRPGPHLTPLTLETANALLPPLGSHLRRWFVTAADC